MYVSRLYEPEISCCPVTGPDHANNMEGAKETKFANGATENAVNVKASAPQMSIGRWVKVSYFILCKIRAHLPRGAPARGAVHLCHQELAKKSAEVSCGSAIFSAEML